MIENDLNAMLVATVTMGMTAALIAWCMALVVVRGWAERREEVYRKKTEV